MCPERRGKSSQGSPVHLRLGVMAEVSFRTRTSAWEESRTKREVTVMSLCTCVHLHTCIHLCTCLPAVYSCLPGYTCAHLWIHVFTPVLTCICNNLGSLVYNCKYLCTLIYTYIHLCSLVYTPVYTCAHPHIPVQLKPSVVNLGCMMYLTCILEPLK